MAGDATESVRITYERDGTAVGHWRNVVIPVFLEPPNEGALLRATQDIRLLSSGGRRKVFWCALFRAGATMPDASRVETIRAAFMTLLRETSSVMQASANVIEGGGFVGAALRAGGSGLITVARMPYPIKIFSAVPDATRYLAGQGGDGEDRAFVGGLGRAIATVAEHANRAGGAGVPR